MLALARPFCFFLVQKYRNDRMGRGEHAQKLCQQHFARREFTDKDDLCARPTKLFFHIITAQKMLHPHIFRRSFRNFKRRKELERRAAAIFDVLFRKNRSDGVLNCLRSAVDSLFFQKQRQKRFLMTRKLAPDFLSSIRNFRISSAGTFVKSAKIKAWLFSKSSFARCKLFFFLNSWFS